MRRLFLALAILTIASLGTTVPACTIRGLADGVHPLDGDAGHLEGGRGDGGDGGSGVTCAADVAHDPANCGRCGRTCSGPCEGGICDVSTIIEGQPTISALATNGTFVAWVSGAKNLRACSVGGCTTPLSVMQVDLSGKLAVEGDVVFYSTGVTSAHGLNKCTLPGCKDDVTLGYDLGRPTALAVDQGAVFLLEPEGRRVLRYSCGGADCWKEIALNARADGAIALGLQDVYWSELDTPGAIYSCPRTGCPNATARVFAANQTTPRALAADLGGVWWTSFDEGTVSTCPLEGCAPAPRILARDQKNPLGIVSDGARVYWANAGDGTIVACEEAGCADTPQVLVRELDRPQWVALDSTYVYFATAGGVIGRTRK